MATIIPAWISLIIANSLVMIYKHLPNGIRIWPPKSVSWEDTVGFSGSNLEDNHWWVLISATLDHATLHHFVNNMAMLCMGGYELEEVVGFWSIIIVYFITGAAGWLTTLIVTRFRCVLKVFCSAYCFTCNIKNLLSMKLTLCAFS